MTDTSQTPIPATPSIPIDATVANAASAVRAWVSYASTWMSAAIRWFKSFAVWTRLLMAVAFGIWIAPWVGVQFRNNGVTLPQFAAVQTAQTDTAGRVETVLGQIQLLSQKIDGIGRLAFEANAKLDGLPAQFAAVPPPAPVVPVVQHVPRKVKTAPVAPIPAPEPSLIEKTGKYLGGLVQ